MRRRFLSLVAVAIAFPVCLAAQEAGSVIIGHSWADPGVSGPEIRVSWGLTDRFDLTVEAWRGELEVGCMGLGPCPDRSWATGVGLDRRLNDPEAAGAFYVRAAVGYGRMIDDDQGAYLLGGVGARLRILEHLVASFEARAHGVVVEWMGIGAALGVGLRF